MLFFSRILPNSAAVCCLFGACFICFCAFALAPPAQSRSVIPVLRMLRFLSARNRSPACFCGRFLAKQQLISEVFCLRKGRNFPASDQNSSIFQKAPAKRLRQKQTLVCNLLSCVNRLILNKIPLAASFLCVSRQQNRPAVQRVCFCSYIISFRFPTRSAASLCHRTRRLRCSSFCTRSAHSAVERPSHSSAWRAIAPHG